MVAMTSSVHCAAERPFCVCQLLHFCQLLSNSSTDLELEYIFGKPINVDSNNVLSVQKFQLFMHELNRFLSQNMPLKPLDQWGNDLKIHPFPFRHVDPHITHECLG